MYIELTSPFFHDEAIATGIWSRSLAARRVSPVARPKQRGEALVDPPLGNGERTL